MFFKIQTANWLDKICMNIFINSLDIPKSLLLHLAVNITSSIANFLGYFRQDHSLWLNKYLLYVLRLLIVVDSTFFF